MVAVFIVVGTTFRCLYRKRKQQHFIPSEFRISLACTCITRVVCPLDFAQYTILHGIPRLQSEGNGKSSRIVVAVVVNTRHERFHGCISGGVYSNIITIIIFFFFYFYYYLFEWSTAILHVDVQDATRGRGGARARVRSLVCQSTSQRGWPIIRVVL